MEKIKLIGVDVRRSAFAIWVCLKYGIPFLAGWLFGNVDSVMIGALLRTVFEELGLTYLKLGQFLSMRYDVLPLETCQELAKLLDRVPPMPFGQVCEIVESELGGPIETFFEQFQAEPIAAGSVAQVHRAVTRDGRKTAIKVQRFGIEEIFESDIRNLRRLSRVLDAFGLLGQISTEAALEEFAIFTRRELNFLLEAGAAEMFRQHPNPYSRTPRIHWDLTRRRLLAMQYIDGIPLSEIVQMREVGAQRELALRLPNFAPNEVCHDLVFACLGQAFDTGLFHADPHAGNILVLPDNSVAFVDFGIFGTLRTRDRETLAAYVDNVVSGNLREAFRVISSLYTPTESTDENALSREGVAMLRKWYEASIRQDSHLQERHLGKSAEEALNLLRRHRLRTGMETLLFWRMLLVLDSTVFRVSPTFDLLAELISFFDQSRSSITTGLWRWLTNIDERVETCRYPGQIVTNLDHLFSAEQITGSEQLWKSGAPSKAADAGSIHCVLATTLLTVIANFVVFFAPAPSSCRSLLATAAGIVLIGLVVSIWMRRKPRHQE
jgi:ubiquinone biosynthesis protein